MRTDRAPVGSDEVSGESESEKSQMFQGPQVNFTVCLFFIIIQMCKENMNLFVQ